MVTRVSIVVPTYNQARYLPQALASISGQTYHDFELIVVNDGSTDTTSQILAAYRQQHDFVLIDQENRGLPRALNAGFRRAQGEYLTWTSSDNILLPHMIKVLVRELDNQPELGLVYGDWYVIDEAGATKAVARSIDFDRHLLYRTNYINACFLYRRACQTAVGWYNPDLAYAEDYDYWLRIARRFPMKHVPEVLYKFRVHAESLTAQNQSELRYRRLARHWRRRAPLDWHLSRFKWHWLTLRLGHPPGVRYQTVNYGP